MRFRFSLSSYAYFIAHMAEGKLLGDWQSEARRGEDVLL
jgi:hypothetical protein